MMFEFKTFDLGTKARREVFKTYQLLTLVGFKTISWPLGSMS